MARDRDNKFATDVAAKKALLLVLLLVLLTTSVRGSESQSWEFLPDATARGSGWQDALRLAEFSPPQLWCVPATRPGNSYKYT